MKRSQYIIFVTLLKAKKAKAVPLYAMKALGGEEV
jgi:hypothetical protein